MMDTAEAETWETVLQRIRDNRITHLDLSRKELREEGASALAEALASNHSLTELHLSVNSLGDAGCRALTSVLVRNTSLHKLDL
jgi:hypothetical protein